MIGEAGEIKRKIMMKLYNDPEIVRLIDNKDIDPENPDDLIYRNIFPYAKVDFTQQQVGSYITLKLDYPSINKNEIYKNAELSFYVVCNNQCMKVDGGYTRTDAIANRIIENFNWSVFLGFRIELVLEDENPIDENFYYKRLVFTSVSPNGMRDGVKIN